VHGFENYNYTLIDNGVRVAYGSAPQDYLTDVIATRSVEAISDASASGQPFFVSIAPLAPHKETHAGFTGFPNPRPAPRHIEAYQNSTEQVPRSPNFNEADVADKPSFIRQRPLITSEAGIQSRMRSRLTSLLAVDELVQKIVKALAAKSELDNTVLIFTSDNGFFQGEHRIGTSKFEWHKPSSQVPLWIKGPGFPDGAVVSQDVANTDLAPTIAALAGATPGLEVDGTSLVPILPGVTHPDILIEGPDYDAVVTPDFGYILYGNGEEELYDYREDTVNYDPYQLVSRHNAAAYATIRSQLSEKLARLKTCVGLSCRQ
jgi:arylsulfatase A-like enzyme